MRNIVASRTDNMLLAPMPAKIRLIGGHVTLPNQALLHEEAPSHFSATFMRELSARKESNPDNATIRLLSPLSVPKHLSSCAANPEGYGMRIGREGVHIWASTGAGHLYGVITLCQLMRQYGRSVPCMIVGDAPVLARRGVQLSFPQGHTGYRPDYMKYLAPRLARWKINELYLYLESYFAFPSLPHISGADAMTPAQARDLDKLCRAYNIKVIPMLNTLGHCGEILATQRYQHLSEYDAEKEDARLTRPFNFCASSKEVNRVVDGMLMDFCDCFSSDVIHVGGDEVTLIGKCPRCRQGDDERKAFSLYLKYFDRILGVLHGRGRKGGLWGDMLLHYCKEMPQHERDSLLASYRNRAVIYDWHYSGGSPASLRFFMDSGLTTIASSSTHLYCSSAAWPYQYKNQRELFQDAVEAGAHGGMTTAWGNWMGLHEEQFNYLQATAACLLWSGPDKTEFASGLSLKKFEKAFSFQQYGLKSGALTDYLHAVGDIGGPILSVLAPFHGAELRNCLYHTDNVLLFWRRYAKLLSGSRLRLYKAGVKKARRLWERLARQQVFTCDPYIRFHIGPLLMHEHLIARFEMTEAVYALYAAAAQIQCEHPSHFRNLLDRAASRLLAHLRDFRPIDAYLSAGRKALGFDLTTGNRIQATKRKLRELAAFLRHLRAAQRPLPAFQQFADTFLEPYRTFWYGDREHDWAAEPPRFQRYTLCSPDPFATTETTAEKET